MNKEEKAIAEKEIEKVKSGIEQRQTIYDEEFQEELKSKLEDFNNEWFVAIVGGRYRIVNKKAPTSLQITDRDASNGFISFTIKRKIAEYESDKEVSVSLFNIFQNNAETFFGGIDFDPQIEHGKHMNKYNHATWNMWKGWEIIPDQTKSCELYLAHIKENICQDNEEAYDWLLDWMAHIIQKPYEHLDKVPAIRGSQGTGKTAFVEVFQQLLNGYTSSLDSSDITNNFNSSLMNKILVYADEALWSGDNSTLNKLKKLTGSETVQIEMKGKDKFELKNYMRLIITTNNDWCAPIEKGNRRYVIFTIGDAHVQDRKYFQAIAKEMSEGGNEKLMWLLLNRDISQRDWSITPVFDQEANEQNLMSTMSNHDPVCKWLKMCLDLEVEKEDNIMCHNGSNVKSTELYKKYVSWTEQSGEYKKITQCQFSIDLKKYVEKVKPYKDNGHTTNGFHVDKDFIEANINRVFNK